MTRRIFEHVRNIATQGKLPKTSLVIDPHKNKVTSRFCSFFNQSRTNFPGLKQLCFYLPLLSIGDVFRTSQGRLCPLDLGLKIRIKRKGSLYLNHMDSPQLALGFLGNSTGQFQNLAVPIAPKQGH